MRSSRAVRISPLRKGSVQVRPGIADPVLAVDVELNFKLVVMRMSPDPVLANRTASHRQVYSRGTKDEKPEVGIRTQTEPIEEIAAGSADRE
jgi:hypothetical protein